MIGDSSIQKRLLLSVDAGFKLGDLKAIDSITFKQLSKLFQQRLKLGDAEFNIVDDLLLLEQPDVSSDVGARQAWRGQESARSLAWTCTGRASRCDFKIETTSETFQLCLLYTSDAADE